MLLPSDEIEKRSNPSTPEVNDNGQPKLEKMQETKLSAPIAEGQEPDDSALELKTKGALENKPVTPVTATKENMPFQSEINEVKESGQASEDTKTLLVEKLESEKPETNKNIEKKEEEQPESIDQESETEEHKLTRETEKDYDNLVAELLDEENNEDLLAESTEELKSKTNKAEAEAESNEIEGEGEAEADEDDADIKDREAEAKKENDAETEHEANDKNENELADVLADENEPEYKDMPLDTDGGDENEPENIEPENEIEDRKAAENVDNDVPQSNPDEVDENEQAETLPEN